MERNDIASGDLDQDTTTLTEEASLICQSFFVFWACFTLIYHLLFIFHGNFKTLVWMTSALLLIFLPGLLISNSRFRKNPAFESRQAVFSNRRVLMMVVLTLGILSVTTIRPDMDDTYYVSLPVYYLDHAGQPYSLVNHSIAFLKQSYIKTLDTMLFIQTIDNFWAYLALMFSCNFIDVYYLVVPLFMGAMIPLAWFWLLSKFTIKVESQVIGVIFICLFLLLNGQEHRAYGNFAFVRIWQGKCVLMSIGFPIFIAMAITFFDHPSIKNWAILLAMGIGSVGLSKTALFLYPFLLLIIGSALAVSDISQGKNPIKKLSAYWLSGIYPAMIALYCKFFVIDNKLFILVNMAWKQDFGGQFNYVFGGLWSLSGICLLVFSGLGIVCVRKDRRVLMAAWNLVFFLIANPIAFQVVVENATTANTYWRLFYLLPYPLSIGVMAGYWSQRYRLKAVKILFIAVLTVVAASLIPNTKTTLNQVGYGLFKYKVQPAVDADISRIIEIMPPGNTIAPRKYAAWIQVYTSKYPLVYVRGEYVHTLSVKTRNPAYYTMRVNAISLIEGKYSPENLTCLKTLIDQGLTNIILRKGVGRHRKVKALLAEYGFWLKGEVNDYFIMSRPPGRTIFGADEFEQPQVDQSG